jgi:transcription elongation factor Elf1
MLFTVNCPKCNAVATMSLLKDDYEGPFSCYKCHRLFQIKVVNGELVTSKELSKEDIDKMRENEGMQSNVRGRLLRRD